MTFTIETKSFPRGGEIPRRYTCEGENVPPQLSWSNLPPGTKSLALIADDPDAPSGTFTHWLIWDLEPERAEVSEPGSAPEGRNDFGKIGYGGPCPPPGKPHRYFFRLFALHTKLGVKRGATRAQLEQAMKGHVLAQAELMGTFKR